MIPRLVSAILVALVAQAPIAGRVPTSSMSTLAWELGVRVVPDVPGRVTALRFWRLPGDPGPHIGHLWSASGVLLATVPFTNETLSGWQEQALPVPVSVAAGTTIVVSVNVVAGQHFPLVLDGFATAITQGHLVTPANGGAQSPAGVSGVFPGTASPHDYFRELVFVADAVSTTTVQITTPADGSTTPPGTVAIAGTIAGLTPGAFTVSLALSDASGRTTTTTAHLVVTTPAVLSTTSRLQWEHANGATSPAARGFEARVRVDGAANALVLPGVTCAATTTTDARGGVWSLGDGIAPTIPILRNGIPAGSGLGAQLTGYRGTIYVLGTSATWYRWADATLDWHPIGATDPTPAILGAAAASRWTCQAPLTPALVSALNTIGTHAIVLRLADGVANVESIDSSPAVWIAR
jgi:Domain of unknown function (DUF4082)